MKKLEIAFAKTAAEAEKFMCQGYCPVECSYGGVSVVDDLDMDHHGVTADGRDLSKLESVAIRAYRDCYGKRYQDPRFVISHIDADCTFAIASLAGYIPSAANKNNKFLKGKMAETMSRDFSALAGTIALLDTDPVGLDRMELPYGKLLSLWHMFYSGVGSNAELSVHGWRKLMFSDEEMLAPFFEAAVKEQERLVAKAEADMAERSVKEEGILVIRGASVFGFDTWYGKKDGNVRVASSWQNPVVVALYNEGNIIIGTPCAEVAEDMFGENGLKKVYAKLNELYGLTEGNGFGGHVGIGGSPRNMKMSYDDVRNIALVLNHYRF